MTAIDWKMLLPDWLHASLPIGMFATDTDLAIRYWSPWLERYSGLASPALLGRPLFESFPGLVERGLHRPFLQALSGVAVELPWREHAYLLPFSRPSPYAELPYMRQRAQVGPLLFEGQIVGTLCTISDLSDIAAHELRLERRLRESEAIVSEQAEEAARRFAEARERARLFEAMERSRATAEEALRLRDAFVSIAAHELRTPLTTLLGRAQLLQKWLEQEERAPERDVRSIRIVVKQAQRLNEMITGLLDVSRIQGGHFTIAPRPLNLLALVRRVVDEWRLAAAQHALLLEAPQEPLIVQGDELRLEQVLQSLLDNAIKYSPAGGEVRVEVGRSRGKARVRVSDHGIGIPAATQGELFHNLCRAENADAEGLSGLGIGLYVANQILELHSGQIAVESVEGEGSAFTVELPLAEPQSPGP
jgi:signal transduction histidine kinase